MTNQPHFWTADAVSAAATALSVVLAAIIFSIDRFSAGSRRRADAARLLKLIAGDLGLELAKLRSVSSYINASALEARLGSGEELLTLQSGSEGPVVTILKNFETGRLERICETTNVFGAAISDHLSSIITLRAASLQSTQILASLEDAGEREEIARHVCIQVNALQIELLSVFNAAIASRGMGDLQGQSLISRR